MPFVRIDALGADPGRLDALGAHARPEAEPVPAQYAPSPETAGPLPADLPVDRAVAPSG
ncbi:hypothetical protein [Streptomyces sp. NPDC005485]|uniref:hypothetical protein n=1 Tax=Streptomyces sp. NPDC005485 TaxID=3155591 RepID=UPI0033A432C2